jgi:translation initiation factor IF-2
MEDMLTKMDSENKKSLNMIIKSDVRGTAEAIEESLTKINSEKISVNVIMSGVGAITENDIMLAAASGAMVVGFHVRVNPGVNEIAKKNGVEIRLYTIIYELLEDITDAMTGKLQPDKREKDLGQARILQIFELTKGPKICGCKVEKGLVKVGAKARVFRDGELIFNGDVASLRRFQDDVKEVKAGFECGIRLNNFADFLEGDVIELYEIELTKATL